MRQRKIVCFEAGVQPLQAQATLAALDEFMPEFQWIAVTGVSRIYHVPPPMPSHPKEDHQ